MTDLFSYDTSDLEHRSPNTANDDSGVAGALTFLLFVLALTALAIAPAVVIATWTALL